MILVGSCFMHRCYFYETVAYLPRLMLLWSSIWNPQSNLLWCLIIIILVWTNSHDNFVLYKCFIFTNDKHILANFSIYRLYRAQEKFVIWWLENVSGTLKSSFVNQDWSDNRFAHCAIAPTETAASKAYKHFEYIIYIMCFHILK